MITLYDIIIIIVIVLIIAPLILAIIITSRRPKFGRFDNVSSRRKFGSGLDEDAEILELDQIYENMNTNLKTNKQEQVFKNMAEYIEKSQPLIAKLKQELDKYGKPGVMSISEHDSQIANNNARHTKDFSDLRKTFQEQLDSSQTEIEKLTSVNLACSSKFNLFNSSFSDLNKPMSLVNCSNFSNCA